MAASVSSVWYNLTVRHPKKEVPIIDYDLSLLFQPVLMLGITVGVALSVIFPYWLITVLIIILFVGQFVNINKTDHSKSSLKSYSLYHYNFLASQIRFFFKLMNDVIRDVIAIIF